MLNKTIRAMLLLLALIVLVGCGSTSSNLPADEPDPIKIALLPILDSLPYFVAEANGYFADEGVSVEVLPVASALERDQLMQAGEVNGMLNEMHSSAVFNRNEVQVQVVLSARVSAEGAPLFRVLAAPGSEIRSAADLSGVPVGISENTIIEYVTDRLLEENGLSGEQIVGQAVPSIPERFQLLMEGQIPAATLPDPLAQSAIQQGAVLVVDDSTYAQYAVSVLTFSTATLDNNPEAVRRFLKAWDRAAEAINGDPEAYRALLLEKIQVPPNIQDTYEVPSFPRAEVPAESQWNDVNTWLVDKGLLGASLPYTASVTTEYLP